MPPSNTPVASQQPNTHKRASSSRVIPAIPLALSKPRASRSKPKAEPDARAGAEKVEQNAATAETPHAPPTTDQIINGDEKPHAEPFAATALGPTDGAASVPPADEYRSPDSTPMSLSDGASPEPPKAEFFIQPMTPPAPGGQPKDVSPASSRKPTDRFDMRHIRTELPPAFVPAEQQTPKSAASSLSNRPPSFQPHAHPTRPSTSSIQFGGQDSSTSSPAPPLSAGSGYAPPHPPAFGSAQTPYYVPQGHAHNTSEPHSQRMYHPGYPQSWNGRQGYAQPPPPAPFFHPHAHMPFRYPPREVFTPAETQQPNGRLSRSRSNSQTSSTALDHHRAVPALQSPLSPEFAADAKKAMFQEPKAAFPGQPHPRQAQFNAQMPPQPFQHPDVTSQYENAEALRGHVRTYFSDPALADCELQVVDSYDDTHHQFHGHKIILFRSPTLQTLIQKSTSPSIGSLPQQVEVTLKGCHYYLRSSAFMDVVKYLYGGSLPQVEHHRPSSSAGEQTSLNLERMHKALQYVAMGAWLKISAVADRGVQMAGALIYWDTVSTALGFALEGGLSQIWTVEDGSEDRASTSSSDDSLGRSDTVGVPAFEPYSTHLLQRIVDFTVHMFPPNFYLDASAPQLASCPRLPALPFGHESRPSRADPRLSQIRFGEVPVPEHQRPNFATSTLSSLLLALPFALLKCILEHYDLAARLGPDTVASIMRQVIAERETRRTKVLKARVAGQVDDGADAVQVQNLYWQESVEPSAQHRAGFRLARRRRDIDTPPSSGACSERHT